MDRLKTRYDELERQQQDPRDMRLRDPTIKSNNQEPPECMFKGLINACEYPKNPKTQYLVKRALVGVFNLPPGSSMKTKLRMKCSACGSWNRFEAEH